MLVAIDGPAGAGKSTVARAVARALGFTYLDTGAMYRGVALAARRGGLAEPRGVDIELGDRVLLGGEDVTELIRTPEITEAASQVADDPAVREALVAQQRALIAAGDYVAEGRDIGTVVAPDAEVKVFLTAPPEERARRRAAELGADPETVLAELLSATSATARAPYAAGARAGRRAAGHHGPERRRGRRARSSRCVEAARIAS